MTITQKQYDKMIYGMTVLEHEQLSGNRGQLFFDTESGEIWLAHLGENERYPNDKNYIVIYAVDGWEDKLKDTYEDNNADVDWDDENYKFSPEYEEFERWYFDDNVDGFAVYEILDELLALKGITVEN